MRFFEADAVGWSLDDIETAKKELESHREAQEVEEHSLADKIRQGLG